MALENIKVSFRKNEYGLWGTLRIFNSVKDSRGKEIIKETKFNVRAPEQDFESKDAKVSLEVVMRVGDKWEEQSDMAVRWTPNGAWLVAKGKVFELPFAYCGESQYSDDGSKFASASLIAPEFEGKTVEELDALLDEMIPALEAPAQRKAIEAPKAQAAAPAKGKGRPAGSANKPKPAPVATKPAPQTESIEEDFGADEGEGASAETGAEDAELSELFK